MPDPIPFRRPPPPPADTGTPVRDYRIDVEFWTWLRDHPNADPFERAVSRGMIWLARLLE